MPVPAIQCKVKANMMAAAWSSARCTGPLQGGEVQSRCSLGSLPTQTQTIQWFYGMLNSSEQWCTQPTGVLWDLMGQREGRVTVVRKGVLSDPGSTKSISTSMAGSPQGFGEAWQRSLFSFHLFYSDNKKKSKHGKIFWTESAWTWSKVFYFPSPSSLHMLLHELLN